MASSITNAEKDVQRAVERVVAAAEDDGTRQLVEVEGATWTALLELGAAVVTLFLARRAARLRAAAYEYGGRQYVLDTRKPRTTLVGTRFGKVAFRRPIGRLVGRRGAADLPVDRELGLCSGFSLGTVMALTRLCAVLAFAPARAMFREFHEWAPSSRATLRMVDAVGTRAIQFLEEAPAPDDDGEILVLEVDGRGAPMINSSEYVRRRRPKRRSSKNKRHDRRARRRENSRPRRTKGKKSKNSKLAVVGAIYTLRKTRHGVDGPINKRLVATFQGHEALFVMLRREADKRGYGRKRTLFLGDGSEHIWRCQQKYFPSAETGIDWYHVIEKLWLAGECLFPEGSDELKAWIADRKRELRRGRIKAVLDTLSAGYEAIPKTGPGNKGRRKRLLAVFAYLAGHQHRMRYDRLRRDDLPIGTGVIEGAVRNLIAIRLDGPGMRWGRDRSELVLQLRCILLNGQWSEFHTYVSAQSIKLAAQPMPARAHDAKSHDERAAS